MSEELWKLSAGELAELVRTRKASSREIVESHLARIDAVNDKVNAVTVVLRESALEAATNADNTEPAGPLHGVPFTIKENIDCVGSATTQGVPVMAEAMPPIDAPVVSRMKAAGAVPLARTNLPEFGLRIATDNPLRGRTNNPWDPARVAGGSSGGEGAALATGMSPIGLGNDIGGSLRNPAYCCGITSLKPTAGRVPAAGSLPPGVHGIADKLMHVEGPMARTVADLKLALSILAGWDSRDPMSVSAPLEGLAYEKKVALVTTVPDVDMPASTVDAIKRAGSILASAGWKVEEAEPPEIARVTDIWSYVLALDIQGQLPVIGPLMSDGARGLIEGLLEVYNPANVSPFEIFTERDRLQQAWSSFMVSYPVVIGPTWADLPFFHDEDLGESGIEVTLRRLRFITPGNLLGIPSVALPMGVANGLPTGVQIYAERWREDICLEAAAAIESQVERITPIDPRT